MGHYLDPATPAGQGGGVMVKFFFPAPYFGEVVIRMEEKEDGASIKREDVHISTSYARVMAKALLKAARAAEKHEG